MPGIAFIQDLAIILASAALLGWLCQRAGLSAVVGYLVAGMVVGPHTPPFALVRDEASIATAAQVGLVFLMFSIGLRLSLRRLQRLGAGLLLAVFLGAVLTYFATRALGAVIALDGTQTLFLAAMLMVSSSAARSSPPANPAAPRSANRSATSSSIIPRATRCAPRPSSSSSPPPAPSSSAR